MSATLLLCAASLTLAVDEKCIICHAKSDPGIVAQWRGSKHAANDVQCSDYTWWHGIYEVGKHFYEKFLPEVKQAAGEPMYQDLLDKQVYTIPGHQWHRDGMSKEALQEIQEFYRQRYEQ